MDNAPRESANATDALLAHLVAGGLVGADALARARAAASHGADPPHVVLGRLGLVSEADLAATLATVLDLPRVGPADYPETAILPDRLGPRFLRQAAVLPLRVLPDRLILAMADPMDHDSRRAVEIATGLMVDPCVAVRSELESAVDRLHAQAQAEAAPDSAGLDDDISRLRDLASEAPVIRLANVLIDRAAAAGASDIHITPLANRLSIRFRIDGDLREIDPPGRGMHAALLSRLKLMSGLDIAERRLPQDGRIRVVHAGRGIDLRVATTPSLHGESMVIRLLNRETAALDLDLLGIPASPLAALRRLLAQPNGIVLVTGPTGSGKTTTLYAAMAGLNRPDRKLMSVEDPVEYHLDGMIQTQVAPAIGLDFARALRAILRHDPDIVLVGEIRDRETAEISLRAALTGHLVLSTLHTNSAAATIPRLLEMGVADHLMAATLRGVVAQRLVRTLCADCRAPAAPNDWRGTVLCEGARPNRPVGCQACNFTGFRGRAALIEVLTVTEPVRSLVMHHADAAAIRAQAVAEGMRPLHQDGLDRVASGLTTLEEVLKVTSDE